MLIDQSARLEATDPMRSFIVQAPAGSGKTEILTQRFLRLLTTVQAPEQIVALTFTRKAANEMRARVLLALENSTTQKPLSEHQKMTHSLAAKALACNEKLDWNLLQQPSRLRIMTIDALCQRLVQAMPLQEKQVAFANVSEKPQRHYQAAASACLSFATQTQLYQEPIKCLLHHLDNQQPRLIQLFSNLLAKRDQWLEPLHLAKIQDKEQFEDGLAFIEHHELAKLKNSIPIDLADELANLLRQLGALQNNPDSDRIKLQYFHGFDDISREIAAILGKTLLTSQNTLRKGFDHHIGLKRGECSPQEYQELKVASQSLMLKLMEFPDFLNALISVKQLPNPHYEKQQWEVLQALLTLLPVLTAHLHLVFSEHNEVDFAAIAQKGLEALGNEECPTDLALYLDYQIQHLLIDEFQDTSIQQFQLLTKLVQEWQPGDGKTLFAVGDPMQSIYRFRAAEVGLFLRAQQQGIGTLRLEPLQLCCNFRSTSTIVDWVNQAFSAIFPQHEDIESGAVPYHPSSTAKISLDVSFIKAMQFEDGLQEALKIAKIAKKELLEHPEDDIAILVRSRNELKHIIRVLREQQIPVQGVDIELLAHLPHIQDVWTLTQALLMPADRLAWLALLRGPWCGLDLNDLHVIANFSPKKSIHFTLGNVHSICELSEDGRIRCQFIYQVLDHALKHRFQRGIVNWVNSTLEALHLKEILKESEIQDLEQFWLLLEQFAENGRIGNRELFETELAKLYSKHVTPSRLQIMTIHKSKGLEFDCIILPSLSAKSSNSDKPLLRWLKLPSKSQDVLLISPIKAAQDNECLLYNYLGKLDEQKNNFELQRLLYVAATRAKKRVYLLDKQDKGTQGSFRHFFKNTLFEPTIDATSTQSMEPKRPILRRLPTSFYQNPPCLKQILLNHTSLKDVFSQNARLLGVITHELLQWICDWHPPNFEDIPWEFAINLIRKKGLNGKELQHAEQILKAQIKQLFTDPIGKWLIQSHEDERNEYELLINHNDEVATRIIDRTFVEQGVRWVIDFKTGKENHETTDAYKKQVNEYANLLAQNHSEPLHCGLYYLANNSWRKWEYRP